MANFFDPNYDPRQDAGTSSVEVSDLRPEQDRDVDLRHLDPEERSSYSDVFRQFGYNRNQEDAQKDIAKYMKAARVSGAYKQRAGIAQPTVRGETPRNPAVMDISSYGIPFGGTVLPSMGDTAGQAGSTNYARKPLRNFGRI